MGFTDVGRITRLDGTNWTTLDAKGIWRPTGPGGAHEVSFGFHADRYELNNPTYQTPNWTGGAGFDRTRSTASAAARPQTSALWMQDAWRLRRSGS